MFVDAPPLTRSTLATSLSEALRRKGRRLFAFYGSGEADEVQIDGVTVRIVPVESELDLRRKMPAFDDAAPRAFLVPWQGEVPLDLAGRFAANGRILAVDKGIQVASLCGATRATLDVRKMALATYLLRPDNPRTRYPGAKGELTPAELTELWLGEDWGVPVGSAFGRDSLLGWVALDGRGAAFVEAMEHPAAFGVRDELLGYLKNQLGALGPLCWGAWEKGAGRRVLEVALVCEAVAPALARAENEALRVACRAVVRRIVEPGSADLDQLMRELAEAAGPALTWLRNRDPAFDGAGLLAAAEALLDERVLRDAAAGSTRLPFAWTRRLERLGELLEQAAARPELDLARRIDEARRELEAHELFERGDSAAAAKRAEMAARLTFFLCQRTDRRRQPGLQDHSEVETLAAWYAEEGGFVDWARRSARGSDNDALSRGVQAVVAAVDEIRAELDERFARALSAWVEAGRPSQQVLPIDEALKRIAARFLEQDADRRLLVLLMDGMAWAQAVEILESLAEPRNRWAPLAWHRAPSHRVGEDVAYPPMLAALPTVTEVSRSAFFAGRPMKAGEALSTSGDPDRFANHAALQRFCAPGAHPRLLLRGEGHTSDGSASREALSLIADTQRRIVGVVVNAIDASLKGDSQHQAAWTVDSIKPLRDLLNASRDAGRHVLLVADHGHVPADRLRSVSSPGAGGGARWRPWRGETDALQPGERLFRGNGVYVPRGAEGVVLLEGDDKRYGGAPHAGEHGGVSLAEVVAPCVLVGWEDPTLVDRDRHLQLVGHHVPEWWSRSVPTEVLRRTDVPPDAAPPKPPRKRKEASAGQLGLPGLEPPAASGAAASAAAGAAAAPPSAPEALLPQLAGSAMLAARAPRKEDRVHVVRAVAFLLERSGVAPDTAFAQHLGEPVFRVGGAVSKLQEVLNVDGYEVLGYDRQHKQIFVDRAKLEQQFQVKL